MTESNPYFNVITNEYRQNNAFSTSQFSLNEVVIKERLYSSLGIFLLAIL
ncbi:hypothetical protein [Photorhabdus luminescens]|nr:hypothetical protein [Photorhabdus luminescens]